MAFRSGKLEPQLTALDARLVALRASSIEKPIDRLRADLAAARFHIGRHMTEREPLILAVLGGTGTGKSTLVNRLLRAEESPLTAASFRRTFTAGPVAVSHEKSQLPEG